MEELLVNLVTCGMKNTRKNSDKYLNWGWEQNTKSIPVGRIKPINEITNIIKKQFETKFVNSQDATLYSSELIDTRFRSRK